MKDQVRTNFDLSVDAYEAYEAQTGRFAALAEGLRDVLADRGATFDAVLDAGAGTGISTTIFAEIGDVVALDASRGMLTANGADRRIQGDFERLPFGDGTFDTVVYTASLFVVPEPAAAVREAKRVLTPDGLVGATAPAGWFSGDADAFADLPRQSRSPQTPETVEAALEAEFTVESGTWSFESSPDAVRAFHDMPAGAARLYPKLPPAERRRKSRELLADLKGPIEQRWHWFVGR